MRFVFSLILEGQLLYTSTFFAPSGLGHFAGLVAVLDFDEVRLYRTFPLELSNQVFIDDLHWGKAIPAPGVLLTFAFTAATMGSRRRRAEA